MDELLADVGDVLAIVGPQGTALANSLATIWESPDSAGNPLTELRADSATWALLLSGEPLPTVACQLALGFAAVHFRLLGEAGFLSHLAKVFVDTMNDSSVPRLVEARGRLRVRIQQATEARRALIEPGNAAVDRGAFDEGIALYERALQLFPHDPLATYELARTRGLRGEITREEYQRLLRPVLTRNPFFEQAMGQAPAAYAAAFHTRLRNWVHNERATTADLADFAAGALDLDLGWWSALAHITLGHLGIELTGRLPDAVAAAGVPAPVIDSAPLSSGARRLHSLLAPLRSQCRRQMLHLDYGVPCAPLPGWSTSQAAEQAVRRARPQGGEAWAARAETAGLVAMSLEALTADDLAEAYALARRTLDKPCPFEQAYALEVLALIHIRHGDGATATEILEHARDLHVLNGSDVGDQARVLTLLATLSQHLGHPHDTRIAVSRSIGLLRSAGNPEPRRLIMDLFLHASCLAELQDVEQAAQSFTEGRSLLAGLSPAEVVPPRLILDPPDGPQRLLNELRFREAQAYADLVLASGDGAASLQALGDWLALAEAVGRDVAELDQIKRRIDMALLTAGQFTKSGTTPQDATTAPGEAIAAPPSGNDAEKHAVDLWVQARRAVAWDELERAADLLQQWIALHITAADDPATIMARLALGRVRKRLDHGQSLDPLVQAAHSGFRHVAGLGPASDAERAGESALLALVVGTLVELAASTGEAEAVRHAAESSVNVKSLGLALSTLLHPTRESASAKETRRNLASRLSALTVRGMDGSIDDFVAAFKHTENQHRQAQLKGELPAEAVPRWMTIDEIAVGLPARTAHVDIGLYLASNDTVFHQPGDPAVPRYAATVITSDGLADWQDLGDATAINTLAAAFLSQVAREGEVGHIPQLQASLAARSEQICRDLWDRTLDRLSIPGDVETLHICADGVLAALPLECGVMPDGRYAIERYSFIHVLAAGELAVGQVPIRWTRRAGRLDAVLIAAPDFDDDEPPAGAPVPVPYGRFPIHDELTGIRWAALDGTRQELSMIEEHFPADSRRTFVGRAASKTALAAVDAPRILHLATHAYFLDESIVITRESDDGRSMPLIEASHDLRCGVALHGANSRHGLSWLLPDDGLMAALELAEVDLHGTELVVLSACETARGGTGIWQTVNGLALACHLAGARTVIASRWKVPDRPSSKLFDDFYRRLVGGGLAPASALREAMLDAIKTARSGEQPEFALPHSWAAWTLSTVTPDPRAR